MTHRTRLLAAIAAAAVASLLWAGPAPALEGHQRPDPQPRVVTSPRRADNLAGYDYRSYMALGDSITYGAGTSNPPSTSYPEFANIRSIGYGGSCLSDACGTMSFRSVVLPRLLALSNQPTAVVLNSGINDLGFGITATDLIANAKDLRRELRNRGYRVILSTVAPSPADSCWSYCVGQFSPNGTTIQQNRLVYNNWVRNEGPPRVDYARALQCNQYLCPGLTDNNDMHVNDAGAHVMATVLRDWVERDAA